MVQVFANIQEEIPSVLLLVGEGKERNIAQEMVLELGLQYRVHFLGSQDYVEDILAISDLFLLTSEKESFGLVVPEASLAGGPLMVLNKSLSMQVEISGNQALYFDFGSYHQQFSPPSNKYWEDLAKIIMARLEQNEAVKTKTFMRKQYNMDNLYKRYYAPVMAEMVHS